MKKFELIKKEKLTDDVFHMVFETSEEIGMKPGQFITFILPKLGGRAYSILVENDNTIELIIKRVETGRGGSKYICDLELGEILNGVGPVGKFLVQENDNSKLFIGTGTGIVPLYNQILYSIKKGLKIKLLFGVRFKKDLFYIEKLKRLKKENTNFSFEIYLSREEKQGYNFGYVTKFFNSTSFKEFKEFYICGMPDMVDSVVLELEKKEVETENIFTEKY